MTNRYIHHPWHGVSIGVNAPDIVTTYIEITPFDYMKYEIDKTTGYLRIDRPQRGSSLPPALYGFVPRTFCDRHVAALSKAAQKGDGDPLDICVLSERSINRSEIVVNARVVGGFDINDRGEADDKIIAVLENDPVYSHVQDVSDLPSVVVERLNHYFSTYKLVPGKEAVLKIEGMYGREHAYKVIHAAIQDYDEVYGQ